MTEPLNGQIVPALTGWQSIALATGAILAWNILRRVRQGIVNFARRGAGPGLP